MKLTDVSLRMLKDVMRARGHFLVDRLEKGRLKRCDNSVGADEIASEPEGNG